MAVMGIFSVCTFHHFQILVPKFTTNLDFEGLKNKDKLYIQIGLKADFSPFPQAETSSQSKNRYLKTLHVNKVLLRLIVSLILQIRQLLERRAHAHVLQVKHFGRKFSVAFSGLFLLVF